MNTYSRSTLITISVAIFALGAVGCTEAERARHTSYGSKANVTCYSGGQVILSDQSTGRVQTDEKGAGVYYKSAKTGRLVHTYADCIVEFEE